MKTFFIIILIHFFIVVIKSSHEIKNYYDTTTEIDKDAEATTFERFLESTSKFHVYKTQ
jgi:cell fate (sporulation/competence/biofilm development) regulator YlbF (YheA/YmcA/DUF963 family)